MVGNTQIADPMARYMEAKKKEDKQRAHQRDEAAKKKAAQEKEKLARRRQKDVKAASKKSQAVAKEKMEKLAAKSERDLAKLDKMRRAIAAKKNAAKGKTASNKRNDEVSTVDALVGSIPGIRMKTASERKAAVPRKSTTNPAAPVKKGAKNTKEEIARRKKTEASLARIAAKSPEEETSEEEMSEPEVEQRPLTRSRRGNK